MDQALSQARPQSPVPARARKPFLGTLPFLFALLAFGFNARAHRLDEYLQATLIAIETNHIEIQIKLTPGVDTANAVIWLLDLNHDGTISTSEADAYANQVGTQIDLHLDGQQLTPQITGIQIPPLTDLRAGLGIIQLKLNASLPALPAGPHELHFQNRHLTNISVYLVNALLPQSRELHITKQIRNTTQSEARIQFTCTTSTSGTSVSSRNLRLFALFAITIFLGSLAIHFVSKRQS